MATLKRSDILRKHANRGRPPKPEKERQLKQRAAYQWRDARRIYLAASFERWRKLRSRLQLKDSSLAWHLLETHDKGCYNCSLQGLGEGKSSFTEVQHDDPNKDASEFHPELIRMLRRLCHAYLHFEDCVELVGLICVEADHRTKDTYSIKEVVKRGLLPKQRTHERHQAELEASEAEIVTAALSRCETAGNKDNLSDTNSPQLLQSDQDGETEISEHSSSAASPFTSCPTTGASLYSAQGQNQPVSSSDSGGSRTETASLPVYRSEPDICVTSQSLKNQHEMGSHCQQSNTVKPISETVSPLRRPCQSYDETDHSVQSISLHHADHSRPGSSKDSVYTAPSPWHMQVHDHFMACKTGELHKVVVSDDGMVSHVVHNGPVSGQVYRIDLSNHNEEIDAGTENEVPVRSDEQREKPQVDNADSRDRAASMESTDSFMEVGIVSKINHAHRLLASPSPTDHTSPEACPVSDRIPPTNPDPHPPFSDHISAPVSPPSDVTPHLPAEAPPAQPTHTSVIKEAFNLDQPADVKTEPSSSSSGAVSAGETTTAPANKTSVDEGDLPLDMSLVKEEVDSVDDEADDYTTASMSYTNRESVKTIHHEQTPHIAGANHSHSVNSVVAQDTSSTSAAVAHTTAGRTSSELSASSSMQLLQHYTDRLLQQQLHADRSSHLPAHHLPALALSDSDDHNRTRKRKLSELDDKADSETGRGVPWPRKDMTQKEEYQYLETDPFMDFAEMSRLFPNMQQRTFYRWKRRIKDQFITLEQRPTLTFAQFSHYYPHVKEHVFEHWRGLMSKGHRFLGDAGKSGSSLGDLAGLAGSLVKASSGEGEVTGGQKEGEGRAHSDDYISQYIFLQKNLSLDAEQFSQVFPDVPQHLFYVWKKQIFSDFLKLQANPKVTYQEFRKLASVTQDVFSLWKAHLTLINGPSPLMSTCASLVSTAASLSTATSTLPPVSLLAARAGSKGMGADLAAWYASYAPLMGQMALPFWSPLSIMSSPPMPTSLSNFRDSNSSLDRERESQDSNARDEETLERVCEKNISGRRKSSASETSVSKDASAPSGSEKTGVADCPSPHASDGGGSGEGAVGYRGRRQSLKPEHYYYLLNPDTSYIALTHLYPGVSAQRYGRWRRKVSAALALLEREPHCSPEKFALSFPNVPDQILSSWRERVKQGHMRLMVGSHEPGDDSSTASVTSLQLPTCNAASLTSPSPAVSGQQSRDSSLGREAGSTSEDMPNFLLEKSRESDIDKPVKEEAWRDHAQSESPATLSSRKQFKMNRAEFNFVQRYPNIDFSTFSTYYPSISVRTFYRWRRQIRDAIDLLRANPSVTLLEFQKLVPEVTEDVFETWGVLLREEARMQRVTTPEGSGEDSHLSTEGPAPVSGSSHMQPSQSDYSSHLKEGQAEQTSGSGQCLPEEVEEEERGQCRPEQWLVHMNPNLDYAELSHTYPNVSQRTFYRWKQEVHQVMAYMRDRPDVRYDDIASVLPAVSQEAFFMWQHLLKLEKLTQQSFSKTEETASQPASLQEPRNSLSGDNASNPSSTVSESAPKDSHDASRRESSSSVSSSHMIPETADQHSGLLSAEEEDCIVGKVRRQTRDEFIHVMLNPAMDYAEFARRFGTVSQRTFYRWRAHIRDWRAAIRTDPHMDYASFSRMARDVPESVFRVWRDWESRLENPHGTSDSYEGMQHDTSQSAMIQSQLLQEGRGSKSTSADNEVGKTGHPHASQQEMLLSAFDYYQRHPDIQFEVLAVRHPSVTVDVFQQWKKQVDMQLEYIRSIPTTNFDDFHGLFPDVKEDIFNIWKVKVLSQTASGENFLFPQSGDGGSISSVPVSQSAYTASSHSSHSFYPQTVSVYADPSGSKRDDMSTSRYGHEGTSGKTPLPSVFKSAKSGSAHSPRLKTSPARSSEEVLDTDKLASVRVKVESSPNTPLPSFTETVSNLGRLSAMVQHHLPQAKQATASLTPPSSLHYPHTSVITSVPPSLSGNFSTALAGIVGNSLAKSTTAPSHVPSTASFHDSQHFSSTPQLESTDADDASYPVSEDTTAAASEASVAGPAKEEVQDGGEGQGMDGLVYSSQRQRKLQRVEYMFVAQNPDVDVQEFLNRFPKVSLRTFYRWKREIREEQQGMASSAVTL